MIKLLTRSATIFAALSINLADAADYRILPGQSIRIGWDTVTCESSDTGHTELFTGYRYGNSCQTESNVEIRFILDWADRAKTLKNCEAANKRFSVVSYRIGRKGCMNTNTSVSMNYCRELVEKVFGF